MVLYNLHSLIYMNICESTQYGSERSRTMCTTFESFHTEEINPCNSFFTARYFAASLRSLRSSWCCTE